MRTFLAALGFVAVAFLLDASPASAASTTCYYGYSNGVCVGPGSSYGNRRATNQRSQRNRGGHYERHITHTVGPTTAAGSKVAATTSRAAHSRPVCRTWRRCATASKKAALPTPAFPVSGRKAPRVAKDTKATGSVAIDSDRVSPWGKCYGERTLRSP